MNKVLLATLPTTEVQCIHYSREFTKAKSFPSNLQSGTLKVESYRKGRNV